MESDDYVPQFSQLTGDSNMCNIGYQTAGPAPIQSAIQDSYIPPTPAPPYGYCGQPPDVRNVGAPMPLQQQAHFPPGKAPKGSKKKASPKTSAAQRNQQQTAPTPQVDAGGYQNYPPQAQNPYSSNLYGQGAQLAVPYQQQQQHIPNPYMVQQSASQHHYQQQYQQSAQMYRAGAPQQQQLYDQARYPAFPNSQRPSNNVMANYGTQQMRPVGQPDYQYPGIANQPRPYNPQYHLSPGSQYGQGGIQQQSSSYIPSMQQNNSVRHANIQSNHQYMQQTAQMTLIPNVNQHGYSNSDSSGYGQGPQYVDSQSNIGVNQTDQQAGYYRSQHTQQYAMRPQPDQYHSSWQPPGPQEKMMVSSSNPNVYNNAQSANWGPANAYHMQTQQQQLQQQQAYCQPATNPHIFQQPPKPQPISELDNVSKYVDSNLGLYANVLKNTNQTGNNHTAAASSALQAQSSVSANVSLVTSSATNGKTLLTTNSTVSPPPPPPKPVTPVQSAIQAISPTLLPTNVISPSMTRSTTTVTSDSRILSQNSSAAETIVNPAYQSHIVSSTNGAPTSVAVVMPGDHRGPAVQLNIQPNSQPTTLITLYQLPPGSQPPSAHQFVAPVSQQSLTTTTNCHSVIPPEPIPTVSQPVSTPENAVKSPTVNTVTPICTVKPMMAEIMPQALIENTDIHVDPVALAVPKKIDLCAAEPVSSAETGQKIKKQKKKRIAMRKSDEEDSVPIKKKKKTSKSKKAAICEDTFVNPINDAPNLAEDLPNCSPNPSSFSSKALDLFQLPVDAALDSSVGESNSALSTTVSTPIVDETKPAKKKKSPIKKSPKPAKEPKTKTVSKYAQKSRIRKRKKKTFDYEGSEDEIVVKPSTNKKRKSPTKAKPKSDDHIVEEETAANKGEDDPEAARHLENYIEARRSNRLTKQRKYTEDWDLELDAEDRDQETTVDDGNLSLETADNVNDSKDPAAALFFVENPKEEDSQIVDKLLAIRTSRSTNAEMTDVEEFFVKYKNFSYLHCEWKTAEELERGDKRVQAKIKRFRQKHQQTLFLDEFDEDEPINTDFITVDRVLDVSTSLAPVETKPIKEEETVDNGEKLDKKSDDVESKSEPVAAVESAEKNESTKVVTHYLVKWRSLPYEECTWELESDIDPVKIADFLVRRNPPPDSREKLRPKPDEWIKVPDDIEYKNGNTLRDYQLEGINWLLFCWFNKQNCILADEMGLGKTIQTITFLIEVKRNNVRGPFLVIAPLSTITNWQREFETWSDLNAIVYHGTFASRRMIQEYEMFYKNEKGEKIGSFFKFNVVITTYEMILVEADLLKEIPWRVVVIDEAHRLKNRNCKLMMGLSQFKIEHRVLLTGTPLQNNIEELFSLLNFLEPKQFSNSQVFLEEFGTLQSDDQVQQLQAILKPMMLRRLKEDVEKSLKPKEETIIEVELTNIQKKYYRAILERNFAYLSRGASVPSLMNTMMELRKCCNHPFLINGAEEQILIEYRSIHQNVSEDEVYLQGMIHSSGKLVLIDKLLPRLRSGGHKVLVFSQMVRCLDILEDYLVNKKYPFERIDGNVRGDLRQAAIDRFCKPDLDRFIFLLCTRAGGLGINLTAADTVIIFDSDWNPQNDLQAQARCHRIGQEKFVKVYRLICRSSYEREMFDKASMKLGLDKAVLQSTCSNNKENNSAQLSKKEIEELLRKGAYGALMDETNEGDNFCEEDIDQILQRRTHTITIQPGVKGSTFAKASFAVSSNRSDIDVNDPNFWQMWAKKANVDTDVNSEKDLILYEPRQRKRRFDDRVYEMANNNSDDSGGGGGAADSDSDTSSSGKIRGFGKNRRKKTRSSMADKDDDTDYGPDELAFSKSDYFRVEKFLSIHGWGRWREIISHCNFKQHVSENDVKNMCRTVLLHCLRQYNGDEKIKEFIWELISPIEDGGGKTYGDIKNHQGLFGPVPRGRKSRQSAKNDLMNMYHQGWAALPAYNPPVLAVDYGYQRHLQRHANKVLLRVRLLYYLEHEVISELNDEIRAGANADDVDVNPPWHPEVPAPWWDREADKSLLIGIFKHGFENFNGMRRDPTLCFLSRCGTPGMNTADAQAPTLKEHDFELDNFNNKPAKLSLRGSKDDFSCDEEAPEGDSKTKPPSITAEQPVAATNSGDGAAADLLPFPSSAELNGRFRKLITLYQRTSKVSLAKEESKAKRAARQEQMQAVMQERELKKLEERQRWSRREEGDFYRALISFGVEQDSDSGEYLWERFKQIARLESKFDHTLSEYYSSFLAMCKRVCRKQITKEEETMSYLSETLSEERANKVLQRIEFMTRIREALANPKINERIRLAKRTPDLPTWWQVGDHDLDLLKATAKHGLTKSEENIVPDKEFIFYDIWKNLQKESAAPTRAITRTFSRMSGQNSCSAKDDQQHSADEQQMTPPKDKDKDDAELTISQILALQTGGSILQWPKERSLIFRLQNLCHLVEKGEWSSARSFSTLLDADQRSSTPDTPAMCTPGPSEDTPLQTASADIGRSSPAYSGSGLGSSSKMTSSGAQQDLNLFLNRNTNSGRRGGRGRKRGNPLQDLMEGERERMRALMHQSFLHQLEQFPFSLPLSIPGVSSASSVFPQTSSSILSSAGGKTLSTEEVLNLSTKQKKENLKDKKDKSTASDPNDLFMFGNLSADTRVPVINLRDGSRSTGADAPTLRNLAQFLFENQHYMIDMSAAPVPPTSPTPSQFLESELEPGEIVRRNPTGSATPSSVTAAAADFAEHVTVINRKNGLRLSGVKAPQIKNLSMWLDKNPDWDVDLGSSELGKVKGKLLEKVKHRLSEGRHTPSSMQSANAVTPPATLASMDPWNALLSSGVNLNDPFQMSLLFPLSASNPALMGLQGVPFGLQGMQLPNLPIMNSASSNAAQLSTSSKGSRESGSKSSSKSESLSSKAQQKAAAAQAAAEQMMAAASMNAFSFGAGQASSSGIFGLNPFLAASAGAAGGMMPGFGISPNFAAMAQLQALMGLQSLEALSVPTSQQQHQVTHNKSSSSSSRLPHNPTVDSSSKQKTTFGQSIAGGESSSSSTAAASSSSTSGGKKLNALVNKILASNKSSADKSGRKH